MQFDRSIPKATGYVVLLVIIMSTAVFGIGFLASRFRWLSDEVALVAYAGVFLVFTFDLLWWIQRLAHADPQLVIDDYGIRDCRTGFEVRWEDVVSIGIHRANRFYIQVRSPEEHLQRLSAFYRFRIRTISDEVGADIVLFPIQIHYLIPGPPAILGYLRTCHPHLIVEADCDAESVET